MNTPQSTPSAAPGNVQHCVRCNKQTEHGWRKLLISTSPGSLGCQYNEAFCCIICGTRPAAADLAVKAGEAPDWAKRSAAFALGTASACAHMGEPFDAADVEAVAAIILKHAPTAPSPTQEGAKNNEGALREAQRALERAEGYKLPPPAGDMIRAALATLRALTLPSSAEGLATPAQSNEEAIGAAEQAVGLRSELKEASSKALGLSKENELLRGVLVMLKREMDSHTTDPSKLELPKSAWREAMNRVGT